MQITPLIVAGIDTAKVVGHLTHLRRHTVEIAEPQTLPLIPTYRTINGVAFPPSFYLCIPTTFALPADRRELRRRAGKFSIFSFVADFGLLLEEIPKCAI
tara:strand:- start:71 stop:370 length:300 start_codon:yes stop_codon:yes gene_type:complete